MISYLEGKLIFKGEKFIIVEVGGVGYRIFASLESIRSLPIVSEKIKFWTHLHSREDTIELYGFSSMAELDFFEMLIKVSGIGPKSALGILGVAPLDTLKRAISSSDTSYLTRVSGIGRKTAEKVILELKEKLGKDGAPDSSLKEDADVFEALKSLGYSAQEIRETLRNISDDYQTREARLKEALKILGRK